MGSMLFSTLLILTVLIVGLIALVLFLKYYLDHTFQQQQSTQLEQLVNQVFGKTYQQLSAQSKELLAAETKVIQTDLSNKQSSIQKMVEEIKQDLDVRQRELRQIEKDRQNTFSTIQETLRQHQETTQELKVTTDALSKVLSNNQMRGEWGEQIIEDLLQSSGFILGVHYLKQSQLGDTTDRPDITLLLPNSRVVPIDVKFPYSEMQKMSLAETKTQRDHHLKQFETDVRQKIKKVATYIQPEQDTLDYALLFVPNELLFSFINQRFPEVIQESMRQRVMLVSPFTLLVVIHTIREGYRNYMMEQNLRGIVKQIGEFAKEWDRFIGEFEKFGDSISKMDQAYRQIRDTRHKQLTNRIAKIDQAKGQAALPEIREE